jgi:hypothetical protein
VWCWPGNTADSALIRQVRDDMRDWSLARIVWVADRGFSSAANRRYLQRGAGHYIIGEKLRSGSPQVKTALSGQGRYQQAAGNLQVKEVRLDEADRFVICYNPDAAIRDAALREDLAARLGEMIAGTDALSATKRAELRGKISTMPGLNRFLRVTPGGLLRIDKAKMKAEANLDGKYLLRTSDPKLTAEDIALGYKQLFEVERGWRDMKQILDLRPVYHWLEERIRAHVLLCWLALLLIRVAGDQHRADLARHLPRARLHPPGHLHRPSRHLPPAHRAHQARPRPVRPARHHPAPADPRAGHPRRSLARSRPAEPLEKRPGIGATSMSAGHAANPSSRHAELCGTQVRPLRLRRTRRPSSPTATPGSFATRPPSMSEPTPRPSPDGPARSKPSAPRQSPETPSRPAANLTAGSPKTTSAPSSPPSVTCAMSSAAPGLPRRQLSTISSGSGSPSSPDKTESGPRSPSARRTM